MIDKLFTPEVMAKVLYTYLAVQVGSGVVDAAKPQSADLIEYRLTQVEEKIDKLVETVNNKE